MTDDDWTPYGLEHLRTQAIRRRRVVAVGLAVAVLVGWGLLWETTVQREFDVLANGSRGSIDVPIPPPEKKGPDAVVAISPGRITRASTDGTEDEASAAARPADRPSAPTVEARPVSWAAVLFTGGPFILATAALYGGFGRRRGNAEEVNFGVYKGTMPIEMITASHAHLVRTSRGARRSIFGRERDDHVPRSAFLGQVPEIGDGRTDR